MTKSNPSAPLVQVSQFVNRLATVIALLVTFVPPVGFLTYSWKEVTEGLAHHSQLQATLVTRYVVRNPEVWHDTRERLTESLIGFAMADQRTTVIDNRQQIIGELGPSNLRSPVFREDAPFHEFGVPAGTVRTEVSMADSLQTASIILLFSGALGVLIFAPMRRIPLAALADNVKHLERSEERFRRLTEMSSDWYWEQDDKHCFTLISSGVNQSGIDVKALLGLPIAKLASDVSAESLRDLQKKLNNNEPFRDFEFTLHAGDGEPVWISCSGEPTFDDTGAFTGYHGTARNETLRRRTEIILRNQKEVLNKMVAVKTAELQNALDSCQQLHKEMEQKVMNSTDSGTG